ncbi:MAG TPA: FAD binding domain-containing protein [Conexivisphaerales archaeon]|nr:FAD binding domain-containing protein [Conexivisphaerales archaeon]
MRTEVKKFGYYEPTSLQDAVDHLTNAGGQAKVISGGSDLISRIKNNISTHIPQYVVDISGLGLSYVKFTQSDGLRIGGATPISTVETDPNVNLDFAVLAQAAGSVATPQIRNIGTVAGDLLQEVWCWYLRYDYDCWRNGGSICYGAIGDNRYYHSIFGGRLCYAIHAGDIAPALFSLDAEATVVGPSGSRTVSMDTLIPGITVSNGVVKENTVAYNEILTEVHVPTPAPNTKSVYYKVRDRGTWDFALASAAIAATFNGSAVGKARVVLGAVDVKPRRALDVEQYLAGKQISEDVLTSAADMALSGATPLTFGTGNAFRVDLAKGAVKKALRSLTS